MRAPKLTKNPYLLFIPFLILFLFIVFKWHSDEMKFHGDESRYYAFASNLAHGFYSPPAPNIDLTNGPGYPIILMPFVAFGLPIVSLTILNAIFYYLSVVFLYKALIEIVSFRRALVFSLFWACYYNSYQDLYQVVTEPFTCLLNSIIIYTLIKSFKSGFTSESKKYIYICGFTLGYLALTKIIFGYVLLLLLSGFIILLIINRKSESYKKVIIILLTAFITTTPYLIYTYKLTHKILFWGTPGGDSLYWMSTPYENEYGDWYGELNLKPTPEDIKRNIPGYMDSIKLHHEKDYKEIFKYDGEKREEAFIKFAFKNIKSHPIKYLKNCVSNIGRLLFSFPYSYSIQNNKSLFRLPLNGLIVIFSFFSLILTFLNWKKLFFPLKLILFMIFFYIGLTVLVSAQVRMFTIIVPMLIIWIAFVFQKYLRIELKYNEK